ncbi:MAG: hypothetical protein HY270_02035 [Deltaproteobacteria bacterium]|nr:hypothetical protein [Deltaproteobacteria bacterium]
MVDSRKQVFIAIRYILILAASALVIVEGRGLASLLLITVLTLGALASNVVLSRLPARRFFDPSLQSVLLVGDAAMLSVMILFTHASGEFFLLFFVVLAMAAKIDNLAMLAMGGATVGLASIFLPGSGDFLPALMRVPFFFAASLFFGYVVVPERAGDVRSRPLRELRPRKLAPSSAAEQPSGMLQVSYETRLHTPRLR